MSDSLDSIIQYTRGNGNTMYLVKSTVNNPKCIVLMENIKNATYFKRKFLDEISKNVEYNDISLFFGWLKLSFKKKKNNKLYKFDGVNSPIVIPYDLYYKHMHRKLPIVVDNYAIYGSHNITFNSNVNNENY